MRYVSKLHVANVHLFRFGPIDRDINELKSVMVIALRSLLEITGKYKDKTREVKDVVYNRLRMVKLLNEVQT